MRQLQTDKIRSCMGRIEKLVSLAEEETDLWDREVTMGEIRMMSVSLLELSHELLGGDEPHHIGANTLYAYVLEALERWNSNSKEGKQ